MQQVHKFRIIVAGLLEKDGKFLLVNAKVGAPKGRWNLPGGHLDAGETLEGGAIREVEEETGYKVKIDGLAGVYHRIHPTLEDIIAITFKMSILGGSLALPEEEIEKAQWFTPEEIDLLPDNQVAVRVKETVRDYLKRGLLQQETFHLTRDQP